MAVRRCLLLIGDISAAGNRPLAELSGISPIYDDPQADCSMWNIQAQAWQPLTPGTNTDTSQVGSTRWGVEARFRESLRASYPTQHLYVIKHALDSTMVHTPSKPSWQPTIAGNALAEAMTQITNAATAAAIDGDTISIDGVVISIQTDDFKLQSWRAYPPLLRNLIDYLRGAIPAIPSCTLGTFRNDGKPTPFVVLEPHHKFASLTDAQQGALNSCRMRVQQLDADFDRVRVVRTHLQTCTDNVSFSAQSMVDLAVDIAAALLEPVAFDDSDLPEAPMVLMLGDSIVEGVGHPIIPGTGQISDLPDSLQGPLTGAHIWRPNQGDFATLQAGVNNLISLPSVLGGFGPEIVLANSFAGQGDTWLIKGTTIGTFGSGFLAQTEASVPPTYDRTLASWSPAARQLFDLAVRGWFVSAVEHLRYFLDRRPSLKLVVICVGTNDVRFTPATPADVVVGVQSMINCILELLEDLGMTDLPRFAVCVPSAAVDTEGKVRDALLALPNTLDNVTVLDMNNFEVVDDKVHLSAASQLKLGGALYDIWKQTSITGVQPLFVQTMDELRKSLRLSQIGNNNDAISLIEAAVQVAKINFFRHLGEAKIAAIQKIALSKQPKTNSDYLRVMAAATEIKMVRVQLLRSMPVMFMDGTSKVQTWNEEAAFRDGSFLQTRDELRRLEDEIKQNLSMLESAVFEGGDIKVDVVAPDSSISPGQTIFEVL